MKENKMSEKVKERLKFIVDDEDIVTFYTDHFHTKSLSITASRF